MNGEVQMNFQTFVNSFCALTLVVLILNNYFYETIRKRRLSFKEAFNLAYYQSPHKTITSNTSNSADINKSLHEIYIYPDETTSLFQLIKSSFDLKDYCSLEPLNLTGNFTIKETPSYFNNSFSNDVRKFNESDFEFLKHLQIGGRFRPQYCLARHRVAFVIPYKNRLKNLNQFLLNMHPFLQRQEISYNLFVVEQANDQLFNKGILMV